MSRWFSLLWVSSSLLSWTSTWLTSAVTPAATILPSRAGGTPPSRSCISNRSWRSCSFALSSFCFALASASCCDSRCFSSVPSVVFASSFLLLSFWNRMRLTRRSRSVVMSLTFWVRYPVSPSRAATWPSSWTFSPSLRKMSSSSCPFLKLASDTLSVSLPTSLDIMARISSPCFTACSAADCFESSSLCSTLPASILACRPAFWPCRVEILCSSKETALSREDTWSSRSSLYRPASTTLSVSLATSPTTTLRWLLRFDICPDTSLISLS
mmetsp:Transcript_45880/g.123701  ORF Transcript_45880/g.123701 Transcript_45880/m.123701 type:complete len:270 (+) Transcript_45880:469-1278(+)